MNVFSFYFFQIITRIMGSSLFDKFLGNARHMSSDDIVHYTNMAMKAYKKYEDMNKKE